MRFIVIVAVVFVAASCGATRYRNRNSPNAIDNNIWHIHKISYKNMDYLFPASPAYTLYFDFQKKRDGRNSGMVTITTKEVNRNDKYFCQITEKNRNRASYHLDFSNRNKHMFSLSWARQHSFTNINCNISKNDFYLPFDKAFNTEGSYRMHNDTLVMQGAETVMYLIR